MWYVELDVLTGHKHFVSVCHYYENSHILI